MSREMVEERLFLTPERKLQRMFCALEDMLHLQPWSQMLCDNVILMV